MKNLIVIILLVASFATNAQQETVFSKFRNWGAFGSMNYEYGLKKNQFTSNAGGGFGLVIGPVFIGGYGNSSGNLENIVKDEPFFDLAHGGLWLGYTPMSPKVLHPIISLRMGTGATDIDLDKHGTQKDFVSVITPEIGVEVNITKIFRLAVTGNYRFVRGIEDSNPRSNKDFEGFNIGVGLRIGWFGRWKNNHCEKGRSKIRISISDDDDDNDNDDNNDNDDVNDNDDNNEDNDNDDNNNNNNNIDNNNQNPKEDK